ncbi:MAG TPA: DUF5615 family PIN-like protein [Polyangiaceae bacterium]|nr:DUF5615 family PIN-like protein [Polyangiaceae bacterium]
MRPVKLLIDENLSPAVAHKLRTEGFDVVHVRDRGLLAGSDAQVFEKAYEEDRVVVTSNVDDFLQLARAAEVHAGMVLVESGGLLRDEQECVIRAVLLAIEREHQAGRDLVNRASFVDPSGKVKFVEIPDPAA